MKQQPKPKNRILVVEQVAFQQADSGNVVPAECRFSRELASDEVPMVRSVTVTEEWAKLDLGWCSGCCGMLHLKSEQPTHPRIPSREQVAEEQLAVVEVSFSAEQLPPTPHSVVRVGE